jgi:hypothetical protein
VRGKETGLIRLAWRGKLFGKGMLSEDYTGRTIKNKQLDSRTGFRRYGFSIGQGGMSCPE